jgi:hypothetical protein
MCTGMSGFVANLASYKKNRRLVLKRPKTIRQITLVEFRGLHSDTSEAEAKQDQNVSSVRE